MTIEKNEIEKISIRDGGVLTDSGKVETDNIINSSTETLLASKDENVFNYNYLILT